MTNLTILWRHLLTMKIIPMTLTSLRQRLKNCRERQGLTWRTGEPERAREVISLAFFPFCFAVFSGSPILHVSSVFSRQLLTSSGAWGYSSLDGPGKEICHLSRGETSPSARQIKMGFARLIGQS